MAKVQKQFEQFDASIRLGRFKENATLIEKRDVIRRKVDERLPDVFKKYKEKCPPYTWCDQGSYDLGTGTKTLDSDFDIDQGLYFLTSTASYPDPVVLKQRVREALDGHTDSVRIRRPCVTVQYHRGKEPLYHVDIAVYSDAAANADRKHRLSVGREGSSAANRQWQAADPQGLKDRLWERFSKGPDRQQFRRVVRYSKRWKDHNFSCDGHAAPRGIGLTLAVYNHLRTTFFDPFTKDTPDDLGALRLVVRGMLANFAGVWDQAEQRIVRRLEMRLPVEPQSDIFARMSAKHMEDFEDNLKSLLEALDGASGDVDPRDACIRLEKVFGSDFPIPEKKDTAKIHAPAVASSSNSA